MDIGIDISFGEEISEEIIITIDFKYRSGSPAHMGGLNYPGHPEEPAEVEIETIFWPIKKWDIEKKKFVDDHFIVPSGIFPDSIYNSIIDYICENYDPGDECD